MYYTWNELFWIFFSYSFVGWCAGVITNAFRRKKFVNTGFLNLPLCPIYGIIGIAYGIFLPELRNRLFFLFLGGCIIALLLIWDYSKIPFNLGGRINLLFCFFWGIAAVVWLKILYPKFSGWIEQIPVKVGKIITPIAVILMIINILISGMALARYSDRITHKEPRNPVEQFLDQHFNDERIEHIYPNAKIVK